MRVHPAAALVSWRRSARAWLRWAMAAALVVAAIPTGAQVARESTVKAAYMVQFLAYVEWPPQALGAAREPLVIGVLHADAVAAELRDMVAQRQVNGHPVVSRTVTGLDDLDGLHALFVGRAGDHLRLRERLRGRPILVVTESTLDAGGMLNLVPVAGRIRFEASTAAAQQAGLRLGSRLLAIAERVVSP